jgi:TetR/AcrR family transcriptional regulator
MEGEMTGDEAVYHQPRFDRIAEDKRERLLGVAVEEFASNAFADANVNRIAERTGMSVGSVYQYFRSKEELYLTVVNRAYAKLEEAIGPIMESKAPAMEKISLILDVLFERTSENQALTRLYNRFTSEGNSELARMLAARIETLSSRAYSDLMSQAKAEGIMDPGADEKVFAFCMDSLFLTLQFSLSCEYYRDRMRIYLGGEAMERNGFLKAQALRFIENAIRGPTA